jgi:hypothetical protein
LSNLEKETYKIEKEITEENTNEYNLRKKLNKIYTIIIKVTLKQKEPIIGTLSDEDNKNINKTLKEKF